MSDSYQLIECIERCLLPKLKKNIDECEIHTEYDIRLRTLDHHLTSLLQVLQNTEFKNFTPISLSSLLILSKELQSNGPWNTDTSKISIKLCANFKHFFGVQLDNLLQNENVDSQKVFDECMLNLHKKLTADKFKKFPGLIEVYCSLLEDVQKYNLKLNPVQILPISLILIDDYLPTFKTKGLKCCLLVLKCLDSNDFQNGNYYEVIYRSVKKNIVEKDLEITKLTLDCFVELLRVLPRDIKNKITDEVFSCTLDQLYTESNLYRKAALFTFVQTIIRLHGINCVKKYKIFKNIICDNIDACTNDAVGEILLPQVLDCLHIWFKHCWCVWRLHNDQKVLSLLLKILYICNNNELQVKIQNIILTIISICSRDEQIDISNQLNKCSQLSNQLFLSRIESIVIKQ